VGKRSERLGYTRGMPKVSVYVPDDLYDAVRRHGIPVSTIAQEALAAAVARRANRAWTDRARNRPLRRSAIDTAAVMDEVRDSFGR
jgi:post-segregation antitoxin (ccd killing protein)